MNTLTEILLILLFVVGCTFTLYPETGRIIFALMAAILLINIFFAEILPKLLTQKAKRLLKYY